MGGGGAFGPSPLVALNTAKTIPKMRMLRAKRQSTRRPRRRRLFQTGDSGHFAKSSSTSSCSSPFLAESTGRTTSDKSDRRLAGAREARPRREGCDCWRRMASCRSAFGARPHKPSFARPVASFAAKWSSIAPHLDLDATVVGMMRARPEEEAARPLQRLLRLGVASKGSTRGVASRQLPEPAPCCVRPTGGFSNGTKSRTMASSEVFPLSSDLVVASCDPVQWDVTYVTSDGRRPREVCP